MLVNLTNLALSRLVAYRASRVIDLVRDQRDPHCGNCGYIKFTEKKVNLPHCLV